MKKFRIRYDLDTGYWKAEIKTSFLGFPYWKPIRNNECYGNKEAAEYALKEYCTALYQQGVAKQEALKTAKENPIEEYTCFEILNGKDEYGTSKYI